MFSRKEHEIRLLQKDMEDARNNVGLGENNPELEKLQVENTKLKHRLIILNKVIVC